MGQLKAGYKRTEVGVIPDTWEVRKISSFGRTEGGYAFKSSNFLGNGKYQIIKMSNVYGGNLDLRRSESFLDFLDSAEMNYLLKNGDILITLTGTVGKKDYGYTYLITNQKNLLLNQRVARIVTTKEVDFRFIFFQTKMPYFANQFFDSAKGGTGNQANVGTQQVDEILLPIPPYNEQRAIADALSDVDALITNLEKLIAKKKAIKQGAMQQLLTPPHKGGKRLEGFSGEWKEVKLGEVVFLNKGEQLNKATLQIQREYPVINGGIEPSGFTNVFNSVAGTITISEGGNSCGFVNLMKTNFWSGGHCYTIDNKTNDLDKQFLYLTLKYNESKIMALRVGSGLPNIQKSRLNGFSIEFPFELKEQLGIAEILIELDKEINALQEKRDKSIKIKQGMMQELLTGKTRLV